MILHHRVGEVKFRIGAYSSGSITVADTTKPAAPQISYTYDSIEKTSLSLSSLFDATDMIQIVRFAFKVTLSASNSDTVSHTLNYEIYVDGSLAASGSVMVPGGGSTTQVEVFAKEYPTDRDALVEVYMWADTADVITVSVSISAGVGSESTSEQDVIHIFAGGEVAVFASFGATGTAAYTWTLRSIFSDVRLAYYTNDDMVFVAPAPPLKLTLKTDTSGEIAYVTGIVVFSKPW